jgi:hypothetical protein
MQRPVRAIDGTPTLLTVLAATLEGRPEDDELDTLARNVLQSALEQREVRQAREAGARFVRL